MMRTAATVEPDFHIAHLTGRPTGDRLGLSIEPASGSDHPTSPMLLELTL